jgi:rSAM/selenodomain-associated transferase 2
MNRVSVVIPVLNEAERIGRLVGEVSRAQDVEAIVVDGGSSDGTREVARHAGAELLRGRRGRGAQMNEGARRATGEILFFLHADSLPPAGFASLVRQALNDEETVGGAFRFCLDERTPFLRFITMTTNFRALRMGIVFGDQGLFVRRQIFHETGGFPEQPLMEDCEFVRRLRRRGNFVILPEAIVTSARRWRGGGPIRNSLLNVLITWSYLLGVSPERLARWYRLGRGRGTNPPGEESGGLT